MNQLNNQLISQNVSMVYGIVLQAIFFYIGGTYFGIMFAINFFVQMMAIIATFGCLFGFMTAVNDTGRNITLNGLAVAMGIMSSPLIRSVDSEIILLSSISTLLIFTGFSAIAHFIKDETITVFGGFLSGLLSVLIVSGFIMLFMNQSDNTIIAYLLVGLIIFCGYIAYDTKLMYQRFREGQSDHYHHALNLFLDLINIFTKIVRLLKILSDKKKKTNN